MQSTLNTKFQEIYENTSVNFPSIVVQIDYIGLRSLVAYLPWSNKELFLNVSVFNFYCIQAYDSNPFLTESIGFVGNLDR